MAEEGWTEGPIAGAVAHRYLDPLFELADAPDTLVLGCTHFPVLAAAIRAVLPPHIRIIDSAATTAAAVQRQLTAAAPPTAAATAAAGSMSGRVRWLATDGAARFARVGSRFLGESLRESDVEVVDL